MPGETREKAEISEFNNILLPFTFSILPRGVYFLQLFEEALLNLNTPEAFMPVCREAQENLTWKWITGISPFDSSVWSLSIGEGISSL